MTRTILTLFGTATALLLLTAGIGHPTLGDWPEQYLTDLQEQLP